MLGRSSSTRDAPWASSTPQAVGKTSLKESSRKIFPAATANRVAGSAGDVSVWSLGKKLG
jgi:hypothetical protein